MRLKISLLALSISLISANAFSAPTLISKTPIKHEQANIQANSWVEIDTAAFKSNINEVKKIVGDKTKICAIMKADAYGNGISNLIGSVIESDLACVGITSNEEAKLVREKGFKGQIMRVRAGTPNEIENAIQFDVEELIGTTQQAEIVSKIAAKYNKTVAVHLALNSAGMGRNGLDLSTTQGKASALDLVKTNHINIVGMMTHFPTEDADKTRQGLTQFNEETAWLIKTAKLNRNNITLHAANSYTTLTLPEAHLDMVRPGGALYGDLPPTFSDFKRIVSFKTEVASIHQFPAGSTIGYSSTETLKRDSILANLPVGYSDGYPRSLSSKGFVLINGQRARVVGKASMNTTMVDVTDIQGIKPGDEVVLFGRQGKDEITSAETEELSGRILPDLYTLWGLSNPKYVN
ncbi:alanine racemase [Vibrio sp. Of7-15]|uniref:alanine racemase n=1 Tax=Vibrio sp. Of7-15 TaxID=2724879 RepID=UPI001EF1687E|nr:alanine racemase [Vibrio sp. Of7-15]MCG7496368.1 alanine racemase [Vibrio sp. Of7-15]